MNNELLKKELLKIEKDMKECLCTESCEDMYGKYFCERWGNNTAPGLICESCEDKYSSLLARKKEIEKALK